ncbi:MAG: recombinase family protein [Chloroflexi bacterium]|nr:recombinase family protein [Chloroflexota bacterium]
MPRYQRLPKAPVDPYRVAPLPVDRPAAVYYRQSSEAQIGNISTTLQTVDMIEHLLKLGWVRDSIYMIDMDAGISGTKKIEDRPGMSLLYNYIEHDRIGLVAAQDVDRFFRDVTMIQTNIFLDACKRKNVRVMTPNVVYDFNHPTMGAYHLKMFREEAQRAADFLEYHIKGRLHKSRDYLIEQGLWAGRTIALGYIVDMRRTLPNGERNPDWRKYIPFAPGADLVLAYFELFREKGRNFQATWEHIEQHGPFIPDDLAQQVPEGFRIENWFRYRSNITGRIMPSKSGLHNLLTNVVYIGHWVHKQAIVCWHNHEPIVPEDLFMLAFNSLSSTDFYGEPNAHYIPYRPWTRHAVEERECAPPTYSGLVFSDQIEGYELRRYNSVYNHTNRNYGYILHDERIEVQMTVKAAVVDEAVDKMLLERLEATTIDEAIWQQALETTEHSGHSEKRRIEQDIRSAERSKQTILDNLKAISNPSIVKNLEASYEANEREIERLTAEVANLATSEHYQRGLLEARPVLQTVITHWEQVAGDKRRELFEAFAHRILVRRLDILNREVIVQWRDGTETRRTFTRAGKRLFWSKHDLQQLKQMVEGNVPQVTIMRAFPLLTWQDIQKRYAYHFGGGSFALHYAGEKKYPAHFTYAKTDEARAEKAAQKSVSISPSPVRVGCAGQHHNRNSIRAVD